jgi:hypothetical protein
MANTTCQVRDNRSLSLFCQLGKIAISGPTLLKFIFITARSGGEIVYHYSHNSLTMPQVEPSLKRSHLIGLDAVDPFCSGRLSLLSA